ncbi:MAG: hypothetical protein AB8B69_14165 [Chitinophagales bacterium]
MTKKSILRKGTVIKEIDIGDIWPAYLVKDWFSEDEIVVRLSGKLIMNAVRLKIGEIIYVISSSNHINRGLYVNTTDFKMAMDLELNNITYKSDLLIQKLALDKKVKGEQS